MFTKLHIKINGNTLCTRRILISQETIEESTSNGILLKIIRKLIHFREVVNFISLVISECLSAEQKNHYLWSCLRIPYLVPSKLQEVERDILIATVVILK